MPFLFVQVSHALNPISASRLTREISFLIPNRHTPADRQVDFDDDDEDDEIEQVTAPRPAEEVYSWGNIVKCIFPTLSTHSQTKYSLFESTIGGWNPSPIVANITGCR